jgi:cytochrome c oxidase subunit 1
MVVVIQLLGILSAPSVLVMTLVNLYMPSIAFDALLMKNLIFFFGHVFINATIYMAVIGVYEIRAALHSGRPWPNQPPVPCFMAAVTLLVMAVYPHHLLMDFVLPKPMAVAGQSPLVLERHPAVAASRVRAPWSTFIARTEMGSTAALARVLAVRMGCGVISRDHRRHDPRQRAHAQLPNGCRGTSISICCSDWSPCCSAPMLYICTRSDYAESTLDRASF